jgi:hypothetical protein
VTPVYKLSANSVKNGRTVYGSMLAGNPVYTIPTDFESIATVTVGSGGAAYVEFTSIPSTYTHLQVRAIAKNAYSGGTGGLDNVYVYCNGDTANNYSAHSLDGYGTTAGAQVYNADSFGFFIIQSGGTGTQPFGAFVLDILDYKDTNKYKTIRGLAGMDGNGYGRIVLGSGSWRNTNAITSLRFYSNHNLVQYSSFALYGIKGA